jgi:hypothetical protein
VRASLRRAVWVIAILEAVGVRKIRTGDLDLMSIQAKP